MINKFAIAISFALLLSGCATYAKGPLFSDAPAQQNKITLYIYRVDSPLVYTPIITINDKPFVELAKQGYSYAYLSPGIYKIMINYGYLEPPYITEFLVEDGQDIFKELYDSGFRKSLTDMPREKALTEIRRYRYVEPLNTQF